MAHLFVIALVKKKDRRRIEKAVSSLLAPYDEQLEVPEHEEDCYCVGRASERKAYEAARAKFGTNQSREAEEFAFRSFSSDPDRSAPEHGCSSCAGTGKRRTTLNPNGRLDWWSFGGRWDGAAQDDFSKVTPTTISHTNRLEGNMTTPQFLIDHDITPAAIVTPDGKWHEEERWKNWEWPDTAKSILSKNLEALAVGLDCHA